MRGKRLLPAVLAALFLLTACARSESGKKRPDYVVYFVDGALNAGEAGHGPALGWEPYTGEEEPGVEELLSALLAGPTDEALASPFPKGLSVRRWERDPEQPEVVHVTLSEQYGALADISLTLADYCIVLTLSQVEGVEAVEITSTGYSANYRSHQRLESDEAVLWDELAREAIGS